jgi:hypothetical protein
MDSSDAWGTDCFSCGKEMKIGDSIMPIDEEWKHEDCYLVKNRSRRVRVGYGRGSSVSRSGGSQYLNHETKAKRRKGKK